MKGKILPKNKQNTEKGAKLPNNKLKEVRTKNHATQAQIADFLGCTVKTYRNYENGLEYPKLEFLIALSAKWGVSIDYLLGRSDFTKDGNKYISSATGLKDKAINQLRNVKAHDVVLKHYNSKNKKRLNKQSGVMPVLVPARIPFINFIIESKHFINLLGAFIYYLSSDTYTHLLDDTFHKIGDSLYPADENYTAGGSEIRINKDTNKALAKNLMDIYLEKLASEYKAQADASTETVKTPRKQKKPNESPEKTHEKPTLN